MYADVVAWDCVDAAVYILLLWLMCVLGVYAVVIVGLFVSALLAAVACVCCCCCCCSG